ncbi:hypothetical protein [Streptomyces sp. URMC 129]|uniref:hypothetical protein n=1 Tax=Streptomyces sp. URMC 129 TaxID=3423407 RepID=UPI003F19B5D9
MSTIPAPDVRRGPAMNICNEDRGTVEPQICVHEDNQHRRIDAVSGGGLLRETVGRVSVGGFATAGETGRPVRHPVLADGPRIPGRLPNVGAVFRLRGLMVRPAVTNQGLGRRRRGAIIAGRGETLATLTCSTHHRPARRGCTILGQIKHTSALPCR